MRISSLSFASILLFLSLISGCFSARLYHRHGSLADARASPAPHRNSAEPWQVTDVAPLDASHSVILALTQQNLGVLQQLHRDIHDPSHPSWLQHLSVEQLHAITALPASITDSIFAWLYSHGMTAEEVEYPPASDTIRITTAVSRINSAFNTTLHTFTHADGHTSVYRQLGPSYLPDEFVPHVEFVDGLALFPLPLKQHAHRVTEFPSPAPAASQHRHEDSSSSLTQTSNSSSPSSSSSDVEAWGAAPSGCSFYPIYPVNSLYGRYNISDQSGLSRPASPTTSASTLQFWTLNSNNQPQANSFSPADLAIASSLWSRSGSSSAVSVSPISASNQPNSPQDEPSLDTQSLGLMSPTTAQSFELMSNVNVQQFGWAASFTPRRSIPQVVSISYGIAEAAFMTGSGTLDGLTYAAYLGRTNTEYMKITARGTTILASSGDDGAPGDANPTCDYTTGAFDGAAPNYKLYAEFPASSPYVLAVGATELQATCAAFPSSGVSTAAWCSSSSLNTLHSSYGLQIDPYTGYDATVQLRCFNPAASGTTEQAVSINLATPSAGSTFNSGGGFSRYYQRSSYADFQSAAIQSWLTNSNSSTQPPAGYFDSSYRGIPDVSIFGSQIPTVIARQFELVAGTSLSAPLFAGVIALLNQQTVAAVGGTLGWANPLLYSMASSYPSSFTDITVGTNACPNDFDQTSSPCRTTPGLCKGFTAVKGWDPVSGLGVPNVGAMKAALTSMINLHQATFASGTGNVSDIQAYTGSYTGGAAEARSRGGVEMLVGVLFTLSVTVLMLASW